MKCLQCKSDVKKTYAILTSRYMGEYCCECQGDVILEIIRDWNVDFDNPNPKKCGGINCDEEKCRNACSRLRKN